MTTKHELRQVVVDGITTIVIARAKDYLRKNRCAVCCQTVHSVIPSMKATVYERHVYGHALEMLLNQQPVELPKV